VDEIVAALEKLGTRIDAISGVETAAFIDLKRLSDAMKGEAARR
jgi:serine O-acetyltransferase